MRRRVFPTGVIWIAALAAALFGLLAPAAPAQQTTTIAISNRTLQVDRLLESGRAMERERRWGEALSHYEDALRQFPQHETLHQRFDNARLHYDLARRYNDPSFRDTTSRMSLDETLELYREVLLKVQTHYVEAPHFRQLVGKGADAFEIAMREEPFADAHLRGIERVAVERFVTEMHRTVAVHTIETRLDAADAVGDVAQLAEFRLGCPATAVALEFLCGATGALDPYSAFLTPGQLDEVYAQIEGNFVGLGIELKADAGRLLIVRVIPGSPAERAGILAGDHIVSVDGQSTAELTTDEAARLLQGEEESTASLRVATPGQAPRAVVVRRQRVDVPSIDQIEILDRDHGVAYFRLTCFQKSTARDLDAALWKLHRQGMQRLIIDLRGNPGGLLTTAVEVVDKFVSRGLIVSTRGRNAQEDFSYAASAPGTWRVPLVVLIDRDSASAAEIFAGAIRDHRRGVVVGQRSYGKGSVQGIFPLTVGDVGIRLTTAKFYSPAGHPFSRVGVEPDVAVQTTAKPVYGQVSLSTAEGDATLAAALQTARRITMPR